MSKLKVVVLFGGCSEEHDVSVKSAMEIAANINTEKYDPFYIGITRSGNWKLCRKPCQNWESESIGCAIISPDKLMHGLIELEDNKYKAHRIDAVFPVIHGKTGEDGVIQGLLELSGIPYVGCGVQSSVACIDKSLAHTILRNAGILTPDFTVVYSDRIADVTLAKYPVFVKPARSGSSFGVTKVNAETELASAIKSARKYDSKIIIEQAVSGCEVGCAVLGNGGDLAVGEVDQINLSHGFFRIHQESKPETGSENAVITIPADLPAEKRAEIRETAKLIYNTLGCNGLARVDLFLREDGRIVFNEVNTMPGFTSYSRFPKMMAAVGMSLPDVIDKCISLAMRG